MPGRSRPRAATSVATSTPIRPLRKSLSARSRAACVRPPWICEVRMRLSERRHAKSSTVDLAFAKINVLLSESSLTFSISAENFPSASLVLTSAKRCSTFVLAVPTRPTPIHMYEGSRKSSANSWISAGKVAENIIVCRPFSSPPDLGMPCPWTICRICGSKPMSSIRSASSRTKCLTLLMLMTPRPRKSSRRPGVQMASSQPSANCFSCGMASAPP
mmetsp:Transcript_39199/g.106083  ORF Transcript_39199/g.106083 Transcript_39199/m.106083 type:complete len:217 (-) Transcript_39199:986-1636(-)